MISARGSAIFLSGATFGAVVALICAPQSGERTRKQVKRNIEDASECIKDAAEHLGAQTKRAYRSAKGTVVDLAR